MAVFIASGAVSQIRDRIDAISSALERKEFARALELIQPAPKELPGNVRLWAIQGAAYEGTGNDPSQSLTAAAQGLAAVEAMI
jgi:hypothetical protein